MSPPDIPQSSKDVSSIVERMRAMHDRKPPNYCTSILLPAEEANALLAEIERLTVERDASREAFLNACARAVKGSGDETAAEPDAWMSAERDRVMTAETKRSFTKAATAGYTIPLYAHPASPPKTTAVMGDLDAS